MASSLPVRSQSATSQPVTACITGAVIAAEIRHPPRHLGRQLVDIERVLPNQHRAKRVQDGVFGAQAGDVVMALSDPIALRHRFRS